jgi:hypothetical protein
VCRWSERPIDKPPHRARVTPGSSRRGRCVCFDRPYNTMMGQKRQSRCAGGAAYTFCTVGSCGFCSLCSDDCCCHGLWCSICHNRSQCKSTSFHRVCIEDSSIYTELKSPRPNLPTETVLSSPQEGHAAGDVVVCLSEDLAKRLTEMIDRSQQCGASVKQPTVKNAQVKEGPVGGIAGQLGAIICAAQTIVLNAFPGGPFAELGLNQGKRLAWALPDLVQATADVAAFASEQARYMALASVDTASLAFWAIYLAYTRIKNNIPLGTANWISGSELKEPVGMSSLPNTMSATPTMIITARSTASSSSILECSALCAMIGNIRECNTWCPTPTDETYTMPTKYAVKTVTFKPWVVPFANQSPIQVPIGLCPPNNATDFPLDQFKSVYSKFCSETDSSTESTTWVVNAKGEQVGPKSRLHRFASRDETADTEKYKDYRFTLGRTIRGGEKQTCSTTCALAYQKLSRQDICKRGDDQKSIAAIGFIDAGCAAYSFNIEVPEPPKPPEIKAKIKCGDPKDYFSAPKYDSGADGATSVESTIKGWCSMHDQSYLSGSDQRYGRWDITQLGVAKRSSFWPRARVEYENEKGVVVKEQCIATYTDALKECDANSDRTHGFSALVGSMTYSLELSGFVQEGNPPWDEHVYFPPSEYQARLGSGNTAGDPYGP